VTVSNMIHPLSTEQSCSARTLNIQDARDEHHG